jgi:hypothetical protein
MPTVGGQSTYTQTRKPYSIRMFLRGLLWASNIEGTPVNRVPLVLQTELVAHDHDFLQC